MPDLDNLRRLAGMCAGEMSDYEIELSLRALLAALDMLPDEHDRHCMAHPDQWRGADQEHNCDCGLEQLLELDKEAGNGD